MRHFHAVATTSCAGLLALLALAGSPARALIISPVIVELSPARRIATVTLTNSDDRPVSFQSQVLTWTQADGVDAYEETDEVIVVPPIATIGPGRAQIFRVTTRHPPGPREKAYRLIFEDVSDETGPETQGVSVRLRFNHNLPMLVAGPGKTRADLKVAACPAGTAAAAPAAQAPTGCVRLQNDGTRYAQLNGIRVEGAGWQVDVPASGRLLAGAWREWKFAMPAGKGVPEALKVDTGDGVIKSAFPAPAR